MPATLHIRAIEKIHHLVDVETIQRRFRADGAPSGAQCPSGAMADTAIVGREAELTAIGAFVAGLRRGPSALVLVGEAGVGKTTLWRAGLRGAEEEGATALVCRGAEAEASLSFAGLSELIGPVADEVLPSLAEPRRRALEVALLLSPPGDMTPDSLAVGLAVLDAIRVLSERGPVVVAVDDLQWLDPATATVLQLALWRLVDEAVLLLATVREAPGLKVPVDLEHCFVGEQLTRLALGPVAPGVLLHLLRERLGLDLSRPELVRLSEATGGNPFFALEVGRELAHRGSRPSAAGPVQVPESLFELLGERLGRLPTDTGDVLLQAAAAARPTMELLAAAYGDRDRVVAALDSAADEGLVEVHGSRVQFSHPLYASICYQQAPTWKRRAAHRALAEAASDLEERARHLAHAVAGPDAAVAAVLDEAAERAAQRGAPAAGAELQAMAADLTPANQTLRRERRIRAATLYRLAGDRIRASAILEDLLTELPPGSERADALLQLAVTRRVDAPRMIALCDEALTTAGLDEPMVIRLLCHRSFAHMFVGDPVAAHRDALSALDKAERLEDPALVAAAIARVGQAETYLGAANPGLLERGVEIEKNLDLTLEYSESPGVAMARLQMRLGDVDRARDLLLRLKEKAVARGDESTRYQLLWSLASAEWLAGRWTQALGHSRDASDLADQTHEIHMRGTMGRVQGLIEVDMGLTDDARTSAEAGLRASEAVQDHYFAVSCAGVLGRLELASGNTEAAGTYLRDLPGRLIALGINEPGSPVWQDAIETLIALGELEPAERYLEHYEAQAEHMGSPWAIAAGTRCRGLLAGAGGDAAAASAAFERALAELEEHPYPLERARTLLCMGSTLRRAQQKSAARDALQEAAAMFEDLGARLWTERARTELERVSGRRPATDGLTATEHEVASLAAQGLSNKSIATTLHLGVSTVEAHLSRVYRKLGVRRAGLASRLAASGDGSANPRDEVVQT
jgi:DNA-binding CsgD family transcriptional regulator